ncbi:hypothetical protein F4777DRAFT_401882 [Nemania sp. FL0916]|nr:hypothetical protein F4777DRAFT_401882 [Nemania sp. FL0916]
MADPLLTSLCIICRTDSPKYKCPRCEARTCSLPCVKKHKIWSSCNGERDATVYVTLDKLKTDAGVDHDYNFLTGIERSMERAERVLRDDKDILPQERSHPPPNKRARLSGGRGRGKTTVDDGLRRLDKFSRHRMRELGIHVSLVPYGMTRSKENMSSWNRRTQTINWQVEWLFFDTGRCPASDVQPQAKRMLHKALDETPLYAAFADAVEHDRQRRLTDHERSEEKKALKKQQTPTQRPQEPTGTWQDSTCPLQNHINGSWSGSAADGLYAARIKFRFFLLRPNVPSREAQKLVPLDASAGLANLLAGQEIVEFPTICVLPTSTTDLGGGYIIEERDKRKPVKRRKASDLVNYESSEASSEEEDGQIIKKQAGEESSEDTTSSSGSDTEMPD